MPAFIRYPFFGCVILALSACGGSGSSRLLTPPDPSMEDETPALPSALYAGVDYLIADMDIDAAREKFGTETMTTNEGGTTTSTVTPAPLPTRLSSARNNVVGLTNRYLSTGGTLVRTADDQGTIMSEPITIPYDPMGTPGCSDETATDAAQCDFPMDALREATSFSFGLKNPESLRFAADRQPVMSYRDVDLSQVRTADAPKAVYRDGRDDSANEYLLTRANVVGMNLDDVAMPTGVTILPDFANLLAVYEDADGNEYLFTPDNLAGMNLDTVALPAGVTTLPDFVDLSVVTRQSDFDYVGYDGILQYSMFFVGVDRFYDEDGDPQHLRFTNASLGRIYDDDTSMTGIQMPTVSLTGEGVMVGVESRKRSLEHYLVQGDVNIEYSPFVAADDTVTPAIEMMDAMIDISITDIKRLNGPDVEKAWYAGALYSGALTWEDVVVMNSKFSAPGTATPTTEGNGKLLGSLYGTKDDPEVGGIFHHESAVHEIIGSFGSKLDPMPPDDDDSDMMNPMQ